MVSEFSGETTVQGRRDWIAFVVRIVSSTSRTLFHISVVFPSSSFKRSKRKWKKLIEYIVEKYRMRDASTA